MEAEEEERESRREVDTVRLKTWEEVKSQLAPVDLVKANATMVAVEEKKEEEEEDKSDEEGEEERRGDVENEEEREGEAEECRSSPGGGTTPSVTSPWPIPPTTTSSPPPLERSR